MSFHPYNPNSTRTKRERFNWSTFVDQNNITATAAATSETTPMESQGGVSNSLNIAPSSYNPTSTSSNTSSSNMNNENKNQSASSGLHSNNYDGGVAMLQQFNNTNT